MSPSSSAFSPKNNVMPYLFIIFFALFLALAHVLRTASLGLSPFAVMLLPYSALALLAVLHLRKRFDHAFVPPTLPEQNHTIRWSWRQTIRLVLIVVPILWCIPLAYGYMFGQLGLRSLSLDGLLNALALQILLVGCAEELFFREAGLSGWANRPIVGLAISSIAFFVSYLHLGLVSACIAGGVGLVYGSLRVAGAGIIGIAIVHGLTNVLFSRVVTLGLPNDQIAYYTVYLLGTTSILAAFTLYLNLPTNEETQGQ